MNRDIVEEDKIEPTYEDFFEEVWEYVSDHIVNDDMWYKHEDKFQELTFSLFNYYKNTNLTLPNGDVQVLVSSKIYARIIEAFVKNFTEELS